MVSGGTNSKEVTVEDEAGENPYGDICGGLDVGETGL